MTEHAYIHIPFCSQKCNYCAFLSVSAPNYIPQYVETLRKEIEERYKGETLKTIYFGGGTPSLLSTEQINTILSPLKYTEDTEITLEINPESINREYLQKLKAETPVNRISIGIQTFDDDVLKILGRQHNSKIAVDMVNTAKEVGFNNISVDLMYGLPDQTIQNVREDVEKALSLSPQHISLYGLKIERRTKWSHNPPQNLPDLDIQADMYEEITKILKENGYHHYEISNFALPGFESKHNLSYWKNKHYYGFGMGASGYEESERYTNATTFKQYFENNSEKSMSYTLTTQEKLEEEIFLGLRCTEGINLEEINKKYDIDFDKKYGEIIKKYQQTGHIKRNKSNIYLTINGMLISNEIFSEFIEI